MSVRDAARLLQPGPCVREWLRTSDRGEAPASNARRGLLSRLQQHRPDTSARQRLEPHATFSLANASDSHYSHSAMPSPTPQRPLPFPPSGGPTPVPGTPPGARRIPSEELFAGGAIEIEIEHQQQVYRLRRTALGKLILTK